MEILAEGFVLRGWHLTDAPSLARHADNPHISGFLLDRFPSPYTLQDAESWLQTAVNQDPFVNFAIAINGEVVGGIGLEFRHDIYRKTPLLGYWLSEQYWGKGIMPQAVKLVAEYAFQNLDVICIHAYTLSKNPKSMRVLEKAGFTRQGVLLKSVIKKGEVLDEHVYGISKEMLND